MGTLNKGNDKTTQTLERSGGEEAEAMPAAVGFTFASARERKREGPGDDTEGGSATTIKANSMRSLQRILQEANEKR